MSNAIDPARAYPGLAARIVRNASWQDYVVAVFQLYLAIQGMMVAAGPHSAQARAYTLGLLAMTIVTVVVVRGELLGPGWLRGLVYRVGICTPVALSYVEVKSLMAAMDPALVDQQLYAIDRALFGVTPAVWFAQFHTHLTVEWFSFFYTTHYVMLPGMLLGSLLLDRGQRAQEILLGAAIVTAVGHSGYTLVPAVGPYLTLSFDEPTRGGVFYAIVEDAIAAGNPMDLFPSVHTAAPTLFTLHAFRHRRSLPFKVLWPLLGLCLLHVIVATTFLRWHWGIDIVAGFVVGIAGHRLAVWLTGAEARRGVDDSRPPVWDPMFRYQRLPSRPVP